MRTSDVIAVFLYASTIFAAPFSERRHNRRQARARRTLRPQNVTNAAEVNGQAGIDNVNAQYSSNWAGAVLIDSGFTSVTGTIVVPTPQEPPNAREGTQYAASAWVGIDGDTCSSAIIQTGVDFYIQDGEVSYDAWYEWLPAAAYNFDEFSLGAGDSIKMTVTASSKTSGVATLENLSTGQSVSHSFSRESSGLCETNAEWIVEDFSNEYSLVPFADFGSVHFTDASAVSSGNSVDASDATIFNMQQNGRVLTSCSADGSDVSCTYV
jgi:hypothetical protein